LKSFHDEEVEHLTCKARRTIVDNGCTRCTGSIRMWRKEDIGVVVVVSDACVKKEVE
jgi:hypothetical protein